SSPLSELPGFALRSWGEQLSASYPGEQFRYAGIVDMLF
ncbi:hypothetical protein A2U01_0066287, partial [Trifolium medium]|nr:hypothetical protein [Trifolium medium]